MNDSRHATFPAVRFARIGPVTAREAVRIIAFGGDDVTDTDLPLGSVGYAIAILHPQGGRIYVEHELTARAALAARDDLRGVLVAWVGHALGPADEPATLDRRIRSHDVEN